MAHNDLQEFRVAPLVTIDCEKSEPIAPGTKSTQKLPRGEELHREPSYLKYWLLGGGAVAVAMLAGVLIGRFLLP